jgi:hypothetical protein
MLVLPVAAYPALGSVPHLLPVHKVADGRVDVAHDHETERHVDFVREEVEGDEVEGDAEDAVGKRLGDGSLAGRRALGGHRRGRDGA